MSNPKGAPGLGVTLAALLILGCGETEPTSPAPPPPAPVASVVLDRDTATVAQGGTVQLAVTLKDAQGATLTGRTVTWSSTTAATASVSNTGLVSGLQVGQSRIVASAEGKSDTATVFVPPAPLAIILEQPGARTVTLGPGGGRIQTVAKNGVQYTLVVPPLALLAPVTITMTPLLSVTRLPLSGGFVAGVDLKPSGLQFAQPATLTIITSAEPGDNQRLVGLTYEGAGDSLALTAARRQSSTVTIAVSHFSGVIAGFGTTQDVEALWLAQPPVLQNTSQDVLSRLAYLSTLIPRDGALELILMEVWFDLYVLPMLEAVSTDAQLVLAVDEYEKWSDFFPDLMGVYDNIPGGKNAPSLVQRRAEWEQAFGDKAGLAVAANKQLCAAPGLASARVAALNNALFWRRLALLKYFVAETPQNGLDLTAFRAGLCATSISQNLLLPDPLVEGEVNTLDVTFALRFNDGVVLPADFFVTTIGQGADLQFPGATAAAPPGFYTGLVTPTGGTVTLNLAACYAGGQFVPFTIIADEICHSEPLVRDVEPALAIDTGSLPAGTVGASYTASLQASGGSGSYQWSVTAGQLPPGLSLGSSGTITGTPTTAGTFGFTASVLSGTKNAQRALSVTVGGTSAPTDPTITGSYDGTQTVTCCAPSFTTSTVSSGPARWWLLTGLSGSPPYVLVPGLLSNPTPPFPTSFVPVFNVPAGGGAFAVVPGASTTLSGSVGNGQLQFVWTASCSNMPPFSSSISGTCRVTFNGTRNPSPALAWHFDTDLEGWSCSSSTDCKWQLLSSQQFPLTSGWVALQDIGEAVSRNIALPSNARFIRFDASTHNVPGDVSRVAVQVGGVTVLDSVFTNPGSNTAFNFVTMTIDISARAGQTVNIRFVQLDDGQGNPKTLKIDNISISPN